MIWRLVVTGLMLIVAARLAMAQTTTTISAGIEALARRDIGGAKREFSRAAAHANPAVRSAGEQWLGHIAWRVNGDQATAATHLARALAQANDSSMVLVERARLEGFQRHYRDGVRTALAAMQRGVDGERRGVAARTLIALAVDGAFAAQRSRVSDSLDLAIVGVARDTIAGRVSRFVGRTNDAQSLLYAGILLRDADAIETGWRSYYTLLDPGPADAIRAAEDLIHRGTATMRIDPESGAAWRDIVAGLAASRLYEPAGLFIRVARPLQTAITPPLGDIVTYVAFLRSLRDSTERFYRRALAGTAREGDLDRVINGRTRALWRELSWPAGPAQFYPAAVPAELLRRFNTVMSVDRGAQIPEIHLAHVVTSFVPVAPITSGAGHRLVVLDGLAANGVDAWLLEGGGGKAGWASGDSVFEIRTAFTETPFRAWVGLADPQSMPGEVFRIYRDSIADIERARTDSTGFFPGVAERMFRAGATAILDSLYNERMEQGDRQLVFVRILFRHLTFTTITLHESRHVADARSNRITSGVDAEFRAKIDEVSRAERPRLAMTAILTPSIGSRSAHGQANRRIMVGLVRWIRANGGAITGYDPSLPALLQLPNLSDAQLIAAFRSLRSSS